MLPLHAEPGDQIEPFTALRLLTAWTFEPVLLTVLVVVGALYLYGVHRLRARGDDWSRGRTFAFVGLGLGSAVIATQSALGTYDTVLLSVHMGQHMILSMFTPLAMALGAPVTLALRTLPRKPRGWLLSVLHSGFAKVICFPMIGFTLFVLSPWALYFSGWYDATLRSTVLHDLLHVHFIAVGALFFWPLLGLDPVPGRVIYPFRLILTFLTLPFHAFLGITIMSANRLIAEDWYTSFGRAWPPSPQHDQYIAGGLLWGSGDIIGLIFFGVLFVQWVRQSQREAKREDRRLDRLEEQARRADQAPR
ncbi:cytochrome c oxidase assembly protein [Kribbella sp. CA-293567]|uniref:cytochrome c oxidase assembly protein n=1 Tax=Kribbella sp. CA-293567 TaxID=3002436 RepID=UPI0022DDC322|nr:cytochrome c oxidase assembly protein [Kribbella sp. CA-293567]WBQ02684.1 cytochrome c oxidase assembly protein [Kribbella sp. CA-293567]